VPACDVGPPARRKPRRCPSKWQEAASRRRPKRVEDGDARAEHIAGVVAGKWAAHRDHRAVVVTNASPHRERHRARHRCCSPPMPASSATRSASSRGTARRRCNHRPPVVSGGQRIADQWKSGRSKTSWRTPRREGILRMSSPMRNRGFDFCPGRGLNHRAGALHFSHALGSTAGRLSR